MPSKTDATQIAELDLHGESFILHAHRAIYWPAEQALIMADLHLGKNQHFRKNGIGVPQAVSLSNFNRLQELIDSFRPREILFLGDLFHSDYNMIWEVLRGFVRQHPAIEFSLVPGNHDILDASQYGEAGIVLLDPVVERKGFLLSHHPLDQVPEERYLLHGHIHPSVQLKGKGRQSMRLPCFHFGSSAGVLPAYGAFTGLAKVYPGKGDRVFGIYRRTQIIRLEN